MEQQINQNTDGELTNLNWLTDLDHQTMNIFNQLNVNNEMSPKTSEPVNASKTVKDNDSPRIRTKKPKKSKPPQSKLRNLAPKDRYEAFLNKVREDLEVLRKSEHLYKADSNLKPPFYFYRMIGMAMMDTGHQLTLKEICAWIKMKFAYFRNGTKWNNSIRHNLSLHPYFCNMGRNKEQKGKDKGGFWKLGIDPKKLYKKRIRNRKLNNTLVNKKKIVNKDAKIMKKDCLMLLKKGKKTDIEINNSNKTLICTPTNSKETKLESKEKTFAGIEMMNDDGLETVPYQTFNVIQIISSNNDHQLDENIEYFQNDIELISDFDLQSEENNSSSGNTITDISIMDHVNNFLATSNHLQPYQNECPLPQISEYPCQLERIESDPSSSSSSISSSIITQQAQTPFYGPMYLVDNVVSGDLMIDNSSEERPTFIISTADTTPTTISLPPSSPSAITKIINYQILQDDDLDGEAQSLSITNRKCHTGFMVPVVDNTNSMINLNVSSPSPVTSSSASLASTSSPSSSSSAFSISPLYSAHFIHPTITATIQDIDYPNSYNPYVDNIDEDFYYLQNIDNRNDDILENLFGISSNDY